MRAPLIPDDPNNPYPGGVDQFGNPIDDPSQYGTYAGYAPPLAPPPDLTPPAAAQPGAPAAPPLSPGGGGTGSGAYTGGLGAENPFAAWGRQFTAPTPQPLPDVPQFDPRASVPNAPVFQGPEVVKPDPFSYDPFVGPSVAEASSDPSWKFRQDQGTDRLQNWAAARGTLNDSGTAKALIDYGQQSASQEYQSIWNRDYSAYNTNRQGALDTYNTNYKTQFSDPWAESYQNAQAAFAPRMSEWEALVASGRDANQASLLGYQTNAANVQHLNDTANSNSWNDYLLGWQDYENRRQQGVSFALGS